MAEVGLAFAFILPDVFGIAPDAAPVTPQIARVALEIPPVLPHVPRVGVGKTLFLGRYNRKLRRPPETERWIRLWH
jgi:hypothetical protein